MSSPVRWKDAGSEASPELRSIMQHARAQAPDAAQIEALTACVLAQQPAPAPTLTAQGALSTGGALAGAGSGLLVLAALGAIGASLWWALPDRASTSRTRRPVPAQVEATEAPAPPAGGQTNRHETADAPAAAPRPAAKTGKVTRASRIQPAPAQASPTGELQLLHAARAAHRRAPREALDMLRQHERDYPRSAFGEEREALMIELLLYFDPAQATERLTSFERNYPSSPYRARLQRGP